MTFEHIVQVNDLTRTDVPNISRDALWHGLSQRARRPDRFLEELEDFELLEDEGHYLKRCLTLPGLTVYDEVWLTPQEQVAFHIIPDEHTPGGELLMCIDEPEPESLFVRFQYNARSIEQPGDTLPYDQVVQQAYVDTDVKTIQTIRQLSLTNAL